MFAKKLFHKVSKKPRARPSRGLGPRDVNPRLVYHYGIPEGARCLAYDSVQKILAVSTVDGRIKLFGSGNTQCLLESDETVPSKFLQFFENQGILLNVTMSNHIQVWDISKKKLCHVHLYQREITSFTVLKENSYMYIGDHIGCISVLKLEIETCHLESMHYHIPFSESYGTRFEVAGDTAVKYVMPQPKVETSRVLIIFEDGTLSLWGLKESKSIFITGGTISLAPRVKPRKVLSACWVCSSGGKVAVGYDNGEIFVWGIPKQADQNMFLASDQRATCNSPNIPLLKINLNYKVDKVPIASLRCIANRLYINGDSDHGSANLFQIVTLNENAESRTIKLILSLPDACKEMEIISSFVEQKKNAHNILVLLLKSGQLCIYDDSEIENYLLQCKSSSSLHLPKFSKVKMPFSNSTITVAVFVKEIPAPSCSTEEDHEISTQKLPCLISSDTWDDTLLTSTRFSGITKSSNLYITGHEDGHIHFWDASCPLLIPILSIKYQSKDDSQNESPAKALYFDLSSQVLISGYQNGLVNIFMFQTAPSVTDNIFSFLQAKQRLNYLTHSLRLNGAILSISMNSDCSRFAIGTDNGNIAVIRLEGVAILYQKHFPCDVYQGIFSMKFENVVLNGSGRNVLLIALKDSSILALEEESGLLLSTSTIHLKNPSRALFMETLDIGSSILNQSLLLLCSETSIRVYSLPQAIQGIKKLYIKKKLHSRCCWAATFFHHCSGYGLILLFHSGKIEIRSLPELKILKETIVRGVTFSGVQSSVEFGGVVCSSSDGELIIVKNDQEIFFYSILIQKDVYRNLESISQVYKDAKAQQASSSLMVTDGEKKLGLFSSAMKDFKSKTKHAQGVEVTDSAINVAELSTLFSTCNFRMETAESNAQTVDSKVSDLEIDELDLDDPKEKYKGQNVATFNKHLGKKFSAFKGKFKMRETESTVNMVNELSENVQAKSTVGEIKKKYGYTSSCEQSVPRLAVSKLHENVEKLQDISIRATEMQNSAKTFSTLAKNLLRSVENEE